MHTATFNLEHPLLSHSLCAYFTKFLEFNIITITLKTKGDQPSQKAWRHNSLPSPKNHVLCV